MISKKTKYILLIIIAIVAVFNTSTVNAEDTQKSCHICKVNGRNFIKYLSSDDIATDLYGKCEKIDSSNSDVSNNGIAACQAIGEDSEEISLGKNISSIGNCFKINRIKINGKSKSVYTFVKSDKVDEMKSFYGANYKYNPDASLSICQDGYAAQAEKEQDKGTGSKKRERSEDEVGGLNDDSYVESPSSNARIVTTGPDGTTTTKLSGNACSQFCVGRDNQVPGGLYGKPGGPGPYYTIQGNIMYSVKPSGSDCTPGNYASFCLDPSLAEVPRDGCRPYEARAIDLNDKFYQRLLALYQIGKERKVSYTNADTYFLYQTAARLIQYCATAGECDDAGSYASARNATKSKSSDIKLWQNWSDEIGPIVPQAKELAREAISRANGPEFTQKINNEALGLRISQIGIFQYNSGKYKAQFQVVIENYDGQDFTYDIKVEGGSWEEQFQTTDTASKTRIITGNVIMDGSKNSCNDGKITASISYNSLVGNAYIVSASADSSMQRYAVFADNNQQTKITNEVPFSSCNNDRKKAPNACEFDAELACYDTEGTVQIVNEGSTNGIGDTQWEDCIIGHTDKAGNSYDVFSTSNMNNKNAENDSIDVVDTGTKDQGYEDQVLAYRSDTGEAIYDADYCVISCKEKFNFILPNNKREVKQGTYFSFTVAGTNYSNDIYHNELYHSVVGVGAQRQCVSTNSSSGGKDVFEARTKDLRNQQIDYLNFYLYFVQLYNKMNTVESMKNFYEAAVHDSWAEIKGNPSNNECDSEKFDGGGTSAGSESGWEKQIIETSKYLDNGKHKKYLVNVSGGDIYDKFNGKFFRLDNKDAVDTTISEIPVTIDPNKSLKQLVNDGAIPIHSAKGKQVIDSFYKIKYKNTASIFDKAYAFFENAEENIDKINPVKHNWNKKKSQTQPDGSTKDVCDSQKPEDLTGEVHYWDDWESELDSVDKVTANSINKNMFKKYKEEMLDKIKGMAKLAYEKYDALRKQIALQTSSMAECTNYLRTVKAYEFDPIISFTYPDQDNYNTMLSPNTLVNMDQNPIKAEELYYSCENCSNAADIFNSGNLDQDNVKKKEFIFGGEFDLIKYNENPTETAINLTFKPETDKEEYSQVGRVGSQISYGRYDNDGKLVNGGNSAADSFEFYRSAKQFFTYPPDGLVTLNGNLDNATILGKDGYVYPVAINTPEGTYQFYVKFANIGQYFESGQLGRIMGSSNAVMQGEFEDTQVCNYEVCRMDDPDCNPNPCPPDSDDPECIDAKACSDVIINEKSCNNGNVSNVTDDEYLECLGKVMDADDNKGICCDDFERLINSRMNTPGSIYSNGFLPSKDEGKGLKFDLYDYMNEHCSETSVCNSFSLISTSISASSQNSDNTIIIDNESLQMNARTISLNKIFMDENSRGVNWTTNEARTVEQNIIQHGETIFDNDPDYEMTLNAECISAIKEYNNAQDSSGNDTLGNGGYNDYTLVVKDESSKPGSVAVWDEDNNFFKAVSKACGLSYREPDEIQDSSKVKS